MQSTSSEKTQRPVRRANEEQRMRSSHCELNQLETWFLIEINAYVLNYT